MESLDDFNDPPWWPPGPIEKPNGPTGIEPAIKEKKPRSRLLPAALIGGIVGGALTVGTLAVTDVIDLTPDEPVFSVEVGTGEPLTGLAQITARALPSITRVVVSETDEDGNLRPFATGSAVGFSNEGHLVTNAHVVSDADRIHVELIDGRLVEATLIGADPLTDVAVIQIPVGLVPPIVLATNSTVSIGDTALAVGNPLGLEGGPSVTTGVVSAFGRQLAIADRELPPLVGLIQTDAPISGGSSGGALLNANGELIGITTAKSSSIDTEGLGFAIPVDLVTNIASTLITDGEVHHPFLGILGATFVETLPDGSTRPSGAQIAGILGSDAQDLVDHSAFGDAGARVNDVIVTFDGHPIRTMNDLAALLRFYRSGQTIDVGLKRGDQSITISLTLDTRPEGV